MKKAAIICVGKIKTTFWQQACEHFLKMLAPLRDVEIIETRDSGLKGEARLKQEASRLLACLNGGDAPVALADQGKSLTSKQFAGQLRFFDERLLKRPCFIIGGPYGLGEEILQNCQSIISLSPMTWPHELARVLLLEQIYRAESILRGSPYHHG